MLFSRSPSISRFDPDTVRYSSLLTWKLLILLTFPQSIRIVSCQISANDESRCRPVASQVVRLVPPASVACLRPRSFGGYGNRAFGCSLHEVLPARARSQFAQFLLVEPGH